jgi:hypothetical protein
VFTTHLSLCRLCVLHQVPGQGEMRHGTEGWRCLETSMRAMVAILQGLGAAAAAHITRDIIELMKE